LRETLNTFFSRRQESNKQEKKKKKVEEEEEVPKLFRAFVSTARF